MKTQEKSIHEKNEPLPFAIQAQAIHSAQNGILIIDAKRDEHPIVFCNSAVEAMTGYKQDELLGRSCQVLLGHDPEQQSDEQLQAAIQNASECQIVIRYIHEDGTRVWNELTISPVKDEFGKSTHFLGILTDVTRYKESQDELERKKSLFEGILQGIPDALMLANLDRKLTFCNPGVRKVFGYEPEEMVGQSTSILYHNREDYERQGEIRFHRGAESHYVPVQLLLKRKNGEPFQGELIGTILKSQNGEPLGFLGLVRDVTERMESEAERQRYYRVLEALATGTRIDDLLKLVVQLAEEARPGMLGSILLLDETKQFLNTGYAASLPAEYNEAINGVRIGEGIGSCGTAAYERRQVIVQEIATHPYWKHYRHLAEAANLRACWSEPILSPDGECLGSLAMYFQEPQSPSSSDSELLKHSAQLAGIVLDRARAYDRVKRSEQRYRSLVETFNSIVWTTSADGQVVSRQSAWEEYTGQSFDQVYGDGWAQVIHPDDRQRIMGSWRKSFQSGTKFQTNGRLWNAKTKQYRYFDVYAVPIRDETGKILEWVGTTTDVHERRSAENALQIHEERLSLALRVTNDAIWDCDLVDGTVWWNEAYQKQFGRPVDTNNSWQWWIDRIHPADRTRIHDSIQAFAAGKGSPANRWSEEYRFLRADGSYAHIIDRALLARDDQGKPVRMLGAMMDVTDRRALEKQVMKAASETQRTIGQDLHDGVGQELTGLAMLADSLTMGLGRMSLPQSQLAEKIGVGIERTLAQVRSLAKGMNPVDVDPRGLVSALAELSDHAHQLYGIKCSFACDECICIGDSETATQLFRIAQEAITNAVKHGKATSIKIELLQTDNSMELKIFDDGIGISEQHEIPKGTGMRTMRYRANVIGGELRVVAGGDRGTMVSCVLPQR